MLHITWLYFNGLQNISALFWLSYVDVHKMMMTLHMISCTHSLKNWPMAPHLFWTSNYIYDSRKDLLLISDFTCNWEFLTGQYRYPEDPVIINNVTRSECTELCVTEADFICAAVNYNGRDKKCYLVAERSDSATLHRNVGIWDHADRPLCAGELYII